MPHSVWPATVDRATAAILFDGDPAARPPPSNRAMAYGDGLFETIAWNGGRAPLWQGHLARLLGGCQRLGLEPPEPSLLAGEAARLAPAQGRAVLRLTVFRKAAAGGSGRGYRPAGSSAVHRLWTVHEWPGEEAGGAALGTVGESGIACAVQPQLAGLKHLNRLEQVLAAGECERMGWDEALMFTAGGVLVGAVAGNVIYRRHGEWLTPAVEQAGVAGVARAWLLARGRVAIEPVATERAIWRAPERHGITALAVVNAVRGVRPVVAYRGRHLAEPEAAGDLKQALAAVLNGGGG